MSVRCHPRVPGKGIMSAISTSDSYEKAPTLLEYNKEKKSAAAEWSQVSECAACLSKRVSPFATIRFISYYRCRHCGFIFANPRPTDAYLKEFYNSPFYNNYRVCERQRLAIDKYFSISTQSIPMVADWIKDYPKARVLDFGCGPGSFLAYLRDKYGFTDLYGVELNKQSAAVAREMHGLHIATDLSDVQSESFDIVVLIEVIEHINDVEHIMKLVNKLVRPGGKLLVTTDAVNNIVSTYFPSWAPHFTGPSHISLFSESALSQLLSRFGYEVERRYAVPADQLFGDFVLSPFYTLDFASPISMTDLDDRLYVPNRLARQLGFQPTRTPPRLFRMIRRLDNILGRALSRIYPSRLSSHQFVLARKA